MRNEQPCIVYAIWIKNVAPGEVQKMRIRRVNELPGLRERDIDGKRDLTKTADQLSEDHELLLHVRVTWRPNRVEDADKIARRMFFRESRTAI